MLPVGHHAEHLLELAHRLRRNRLDLDTGFTREDLSQDPELVKAAGKAKAQLIDNLESQIASLRSFNKGDPKAAESAMGVLTAEHEKAMTDLSSMYTASTISAVKLAIEAAAAVGTGPGGAVAMKASERVAAILTGNDEGTKQELLGLPGMDAAALTAIGSQMDKVADANAKVNAASRALTQKMSEYSLAVAGDTHTMIEGIKRQLTRAKNELAELQESYTISQRVRQPGGSSPPAAPDGTPTQTLDQVGKMPAGNGGSRWSEIHVKSSAEDSFSDTSSVATSSLSSSTCNFWIGSHSSSSATTAATNTATTSDTSLTVEVSMRATYVTVDRSGWFDPSFFDMSKAFMRGAKDENYVPWSSWVKTTATTGVAADDYGTPKEEADAIVSNAVNKPTGYLAAFPVGYVLVKDCTIKVTAKAVHSNAFKSDFDERSESSGGFLCFSHSSGSRSSSDSSSSKTVATSDGVVIRIPGPQILGYMMQLTGKDQSQQAELPRISLRVGMKPEALGGPAAGAQKPSSGTRSYDDVSVPPPLSSPPSVEKQPEPAVKKPEHAAAAAGPEQKSFDLDNLSQEMKDKLLTAVLSLLRK
ncbi:hypothetical protein Micbo1qcDRAFT_205214 [Microdochium bolleyi]|uniref:Uncharacterized protein n=1 Tax=Microdochium bolleyi TaxID=196109 RepID=A0A136J031_9PEZI|nr:hypothetical protein Micbo1qcDRAFT_205214 [Microdochium bolleyi]